MPHVGGDGFPIIHLPTSGNIGRPAARAHPTDVFWALLRSYQQGICHTFRKGDTPRIGPQLSAQRSLQKAN